MKSSIKTMILGLAATCLFAGCGSQNPIAKYPNLQQSTQSSPQLFTPDSQDSSDVAVGSKGSEDFFIRSAFRNSDVKITSVHLNDTDKTPLTYDADSDSYSATKDGVSITLTCTAADDDMQKRVSCTSTCVKSCTANIQSNCSASEGSVELVISTESISGSSKSDRDLSKPIDLKGQAKKCPKGSKS